MLYRVKDWSENFENNKSRERDQCSFFCVPNKQHGLGFTRVMMEKDGAAIYGIWICILATCSQQKKPRDGWLTQNGQQAGTKLTQDDLAVKFRRPIKEIERCIEFLCLPSIGWIEIVQCAADDALAPSARRVPAECPHGVVKGRGEKGNEGERREAREDAEIVEAWNGLPAVFGKVQRLTDGRKKALSARLKDEWWNANWRAALVKIPSQPFLSGSNQRGWKADFDFFIQPDAVAKILEGKYTNGNNSAQGGAVAAAAAGRHHALRPSEIPPIIEINGNEPA